MQVNSAQISFALHGKRSNVVLSRELGRCADSVSGSTSIQCLFSLKMLSALSISQPSTGGRIHLESVAGVTNNQVSNPA
jgi:hypothetical protein